MAIAWVDNVTPLNAVNMNLLEQTSNKNVANGYPSLNASAHLALSASQQIIWAGDTGLFRLGADSLKTDDSLTVGGSLSVGSWTYLDQVGGGFGLLYGPSSQLQVTTGTGYKLRVHNTSGNAGIEFGTAADTSLYRASAGIIATDGYLQAGKALWLTDTTGGVYYGVLFGAAQDAQFYRSAAGVLAMTFGALGNRDLVYGAADSGGTGFRMVRVVN
jgi:hypothetical protein